MFFMSTDMAGFQNQVGTKVQSFPALRRSYSSTVEIGTVMRRTVGPVSFGRAAERGWFLVPTQTRFESLVAKERGATDMGYVSDDGPMPSLYRTRYATCAVGTFGTRCAARIQREMIAEAPQPSLILYSQHSSYRTSQSPESPKI